MSVLSFLKLGNIRKLKVYMVLSSKIFPDIQSTAGLLTTIHRSYSIICSWELLLCVKGGVVGFTSQHYRDCFPVQLPAVCGFKTSRDPISNIRALKQVWLLQFLDKTNEQKNQQNLCHLWLSSVYEQPLLRFCTMM